MSSSFVNEELKENKSTATKTYSPGKLRIVGEVISDNKLPIGYVVMQESKQSFKMYTIQQTKVLLQRFKFINAELDCKNSIVNTECAMSRLPKFDSAMNVVDNFGIIILAEIVDDKLNTVGYKAMDTNANIVELKESDLLRLNSEGKNIINAKIVTRNNKEIISAIKSTFPIMKSKQTTSAEPAEIKNNSSFEWRKKKHVEKLLNKLYIGTLKAIFITQYKAIPIGYYSVNSKGEHYLIPKKEAKIALKEVFTKENGFQLSAIHKKIAEKALKLENISDALGQCKETNYKYCLPTDDDNKLFFVLAQLALTNKDIYNEVFRQLTKQRYSLNRNRFNMLKEAGLLLNETAQLKKDLVEHYNKLYNDKDKNDTRKMFNTTTFKSAKDIADLGFAITENNGGIKYETSYGFHKTLLYLGDIIGSEYNRYKENATCLGDLAAIANVTKLLDNFQSYRFPAVQKIIVIEMILATSFIYGNKAAKLFVEDRRLDIEALGITIPDYNEISENNYELPDSIRIYYESGFNVFLNDNTGRFKKPYLVKAKYINYRQVGNTYTIWHKDLYELATILSMITSESCDSTVIEEMVGTMRFI